MLKIIIIRVKTRLFVWVLHNNIILYDRPEICKLSQFRFGVNMRLKIVRGIYFFLLLLFFHFYFFGENNTELKQNKKLNPNFRNYSVGHFRMYLLVLYTL